MDQPSGQNETNVQHNQDDPGEPGAANVSVPMKARYFSGDGLLVRCSDAGLAFELKQGAGNARVRRGMIQLAWRFLLFQKDSALARWYRARTEGARGGMRKTLIVALARKLLIALWRLVTTGETPEGLVLRPVG